MAQPAKQRPKLRDGPRGGKLWTGGVPGNKGGGRKPDEWKRQMEELADRGAQAIAARKVVDDPDHPLFLGAWKFASEQAHGQAPKRVEVVGDQGGPVEIRIVREL